MLQRWVCVAQDFNWLKDFYALIPTPALFMKASTATADTPLRQASMRFQGMLAGVLATQSVNILFQGCLPPS
ncbi:MAG: hypothetical protein A3A88_11230 [Nitrospirae bacterium RIFCSPLOWO2_01_FULL_62_17]|nr:MAG: hypothetical protein A3A88_11230 [Nitrospirae bacterium RIFCSPLOWO2_01_FULL_62_17]